MKCYIRNAVQMCFLLGESLSAEIQGCIQTDVRGRKPVTGVFPEFLSSVTLNNPLLGVPESQGQESQSMRCGTLGHCYTLKWALWDVPSDPSYLFSDVSQSWIL